MPRSFLSLQNVTIRHQNHHVFQDLTFEVQPGEQWALVGESGAGKTSLLRAIAGELPLVGGLVTHGFLEEYLEKNPVQDSFFTYKNLVALVGQKHRFKSLSTNTGSFYYQQRYHAADAEDAPTVAAYLAEIDTVSTAAKTWTIDQLVQRLRLEGLLSKQLIKLSNGETKRLLLAQALLKQPKLLLLDMPLTGLDLETRTNFEELLAHLIASGVTVIMATSPDEIPASITHVAVLQNGQLISAQPKERYQGTPEPEGNSPALNPAGLNDLLPASPPVRYQTLVELKEVTVRYGEKTVLDQVNWHVRPGEHWALLGHNGAGKTTLLSLLNGDNPQAFSKDITLFDRKRGTGETLWDIRKKIGFVSPELFQFFPYQNTCLEVVESGFYDTLGLHRKSQPGNAAQALAWLELLGIAQEKDKPLRNVSASVQRLCLLARALIKNPVLLILDEPCQGMDAQQRQRFKELLEVICAHSSTTLLYVTHYAQEIPACVTRVLRLEQGKVQALA
ncbi:ATP-binding cassette domain-containing protein [Rufibacter ruber]|nr:ATP-binding cassette domain-containing protein [Rufibacter ruber]